MLKHFLSCFLLLALSLGLSACEKSTPKKVRVGISMGVGSATRWGKEMAFMKARAQELGIDVQASLNKTDTPKTQAEDCIEMIANGIDVLIIVPRDVRKVDEVLTFAKQRQVKVIAYGRAIMGESVDLYIGHDNYKIGQSMGQHLAEKVYRGDIIMLKGDQNDFNAPLLYYGAMRHIRPLVEKGDIKIILDDFVQDWSPAKAKEMVRAAVVANGNKVDGILAPNDKLAAACIEVLKELGVSGKVVITGMDAEQEAIKRLLAGTQDMTVYLDLKMLATAAIDEAYNMATKQKINTNSAFDNDSKNTIDAYLINGKVVTKENIDKVLVDTGHYTRDQIYSN